jgi:hypothetical protein
MDVTRERTDIDNGLDKGSHLDFSNKIAEAFGHPSYGEDLQEAKANPQFLVIGFLRT